MFVVQRCVRGFGLIGGKWDSFPTRYSTIEEAQEAAEYFKYFDSILLYKGGKYEYRIVEEYTVVKSKPVKC